MSNDAGRAASKPIPVAELKAHLPEIVGAWRRTALDVQLPRGSPTETSVASATYAARQQVVVLTLSDWVALAGMAWPSTTTERQLDGGTEKTYAQDGRRVREFSGPRGHSDLTVNLANGVVVQISGERVAPAELKAFVHALDLARIEALKRAGP